MKFNIKNKIKVKAKSVLLALVLSLGVNNVSANTVNYDYDKHIVSSALNYIGCHQELLSDATPNLRELFNLLIKNTSITTSISANYEQVNKFVIDFDVKKLDEILRKLNKDEKMIVFDALIAMLCAAKDKDKPFDNYSLIQYWKVLTRFSEVGDKVDTIELLVRELKKVVESSTQPLFYIRLKGLQRNKKLDNALRSRLMNFIEANKDFQTPELTQNIILWRFALNKAAK